MDFEAFIGGITDEKLNVYGVEVYRDGKLCFSWGDTRNTRYPVYSVTKSFLSAAFGIARDRGLISEKENVLQRMPEENLARMTDKARKQMEQITLKRLLTMSVEGFPFRPEGDSWLDFSLNYPLPHPETPLFNYSNICSYLVSAALEQAVREDAYRFLEENVLEKLGIRDVCCQRSPEGIFYGATGLEMTVNEMSRLGLMLSAGGVFDGRRIVSEEYVREATGVRQMNREGGYGYFIWKYRDGFSLNGKWGQRCYCLPESGLMISFMSCMENGSDRVKELMERYLL